MFTFGKCLYKRTITVVSATAVTAYNFKSSSICSKFDSEDVDVSEKRLPLLMENALANSLSKVVPQFSDSVGVETDYITRPSFEKNVLKASKKSLTKNVAMYTVILGPKGSGKSTIVARALNGIEGVLKTTITESDTPSSIISKLLKQCGATTGLNDQIDIDNFPPVLRQAASQRNDIPITFVFEVQGGSPSVLRLAREFASKFAPHANVIVILSDLISGQAFGDDHKQQFIWVDEMTTKEAEDYARKLHPGVTSKNLNLIIDFTGKLPCDIKIAMEALKKGVNAGLIVDEAVDVALDDLHAFVYYPILAALKKSPNGGVCPSKFEGLTFKGINLSNPQHLALAIKNTNVIMYHIPSAEYRLSSRAHVRALELYTPPIIFDFKM